MEVTSQQAIPKAAIEPIDVGGLRNWELIPNPIEPYRPPCNGRRLNLVTPVMSRKKLNVGGPATALRFFQSLAMHFSSTRIVVTHEAESDFEFTDWPHLRLDDTTGAAHSIVFLGDRSVPLTVGPEDLFIATFWSTAIFVQSIVALQAQDFSTRGRRFVYLIQDYEPGFYPWSARHSGAESTYRDLDGAIAVFNTGLLAEYFEHKNLRFKEKYIFYPMLHPELRRMKATLNTLGKERLILVYGRPSEPRNDFDFVVDALRIWVRDFPDADQWSVISAGEAHPDIALGRGIVLRSRGQMTLGEYADHLSRCWVGLSFMFSPHPSYPPLEMAEFGAWVVTNNFANKEPHLLAPSIIGVDEVWPDGTAKALTWCCKQYGEGKTSATVNLASVFKHEGEEFPFADTLVRSWVAVPASANLR